MDEHERDYAPTRIGGEMPAEIEPLVERLAEAIHDDYMARVVAKKQADPRGQYRSVVRLRDEPDSVQRINRGMAEKQILAILKCGWEIRPPAVLHAGRAVDAGEG